MTDTWVIAVAVVMGAAGALVTETAAHDMGQDIAAGAAVAAVVYATELASEAVADRGARRRKGTDGGA
jgi:hypothetical protein